MSFVQDTITNGGVFLFVGLILSLLIGIGFILGIFIRPSVAIIYAIIISLFLIIGSICFCKKAKKELFKVNNPQLHNSLYRLMKDFDSLCLKYNIRYWVIGGTALGVVRNKGILPHDDDIDVGILESDFEKLSNVLKNNDKYELSIKDEDVPKFK